MQTTLKIGDTVQCIKTVKNGKSNFFTKGRIYPVVVGEYQDESGIWLKDDDKIDTRPHHVSGNGSGELGEWFYKHFIII